MRTILITSLFLLLSQFSNAQEHTVRDLFSSYSGDKNVSEINISARLLGLLGYVELDDEEDQKALETIHTF